MEKVKTLAEMAKRLVQIGEWDQMVVAVEAIGDKGGEAEALGEVAKGLVEIGKFDQALALAKVIESDWGKADALGEVAKGLAQIGELDQALEVVQAIMSRREKAVALRGVAHAGGPMLPQQIWYDLFMMTRLTGRQDLFEVLQDSIPALATLDQGETLWQVYQAVMEVEGWWGKDEG